MLSCCWCLKKKNDSCSLQLSEVLYSFFLQTGLSGNKFSLSKTVPLTKVVQNDTYTAPPAPPSPMRTKALTNMSRTLVTKEEPPKEPAPVEVSSGKSEMLFIEVSETCCSSVMQATHFCLPSTIISGTPSS